MSQRVPSCDTSAELDQSASYNCFPTLTDCNNTMFCGTKSRAWEQDSRNELADHHLPFVPEYDQVAELTWKDGHLAMQDLGSRASHRHKYNCLSSSSAWSNDPDQPGMVLTRRSQTRSDKEVEGTLDAIVARSLDATMQNLSPVDEDMASWFQYTSLTELQEHPAQRTEKNPDAMVSTASERPEYVLAQSQSSKDDNNSNRNSGSMNFPYFSKPAVRMKAQLQTLGSSSGPTNIQRVRQYSGETEVAVSNPIPASIVGSSGGFCATNSEVSTHANTLASQNSPPPPPPAQFARKSSRPMPSAPAAANTTTTTTTTAYTNTVTSYHDMVPKVVEDQSGTSATVGKEITTSDMNYDAMEVTLVSTSGGSPDNNSMTERSGKEPRWKRKSREHDSACRSEDQDDNQSAQAKKSQTGRRSNSSKRSRAAAVHNQSERRRRDRINERMKALQKLIPNSSKTDKASMLDEAIEYLKHLQAQLQMMCLRNRMNIPPMMLPLGMQQLQMSLLAPLGPMGIGMGMASMGLGMGVGMMDMNPVAATGRAALVPMGQPLPGTGSHALPVTVHAANFIQPNFTVAATAGFPARVPTPVHAPDASDHLKNSAVVDPYIAFMACQRQSMNMNMDLYNSMALLQQQQLLHQQHQQQQLHQQQQQQLQPPTASQHPHQQQQQQHQINNSKGA